MTSSNQTLSVTHHSEMASGVPTMVLGNLQHKANGKAFHTS
jgi:hypothetical protein